MLSWIKGEHLDHQGMFWSSRFTQDSGLDYWWSVSMAYIAATVKDMMTVHYFIFFLSISLNGTLAQMYLRGRGADRGWVGLGCAWGSAIVGKADGRKHKSNNIMFPDQWATSRFNYFFLILFSRSFSPPFRHIFLPTCHQRRSDQSVDFVCFIVLR